MAPRTPARPATGDDWAAQAAGRIEGAVTAVRDRTTVPLTTIARALVYGTLAAILGSMALILLAITLVRVLDVAIPGEVWSAHLVVGALFTAAGLLLWKQRGGTA